MTRATPLAAVAVVDAVLWAVWSTCVGYACHRLPAERFRHDSWLTRLRRIERQGRAYERIAIRKWKDRLPEAGAIFRGGTSKRRLPARDEQALERFAAETRRAELVHWLVPALTPVFALFNPPLMVVAMAIYAVVANLPFVAIQRYNRGRVQRVLAAR
jgi:glycosyl-4,4'-diaponeurosporenoate acyltransferase